jgi:uncharacterized protein YxeA
MKKYFYFLIAFLAFVLVSAFIVNAHNTYKDNQDYVRRSYSAFQKGEISKAQHNANAKSVGFDGWIVK